MKTLLLSTAAVFAMSSGVAMASPNKEFSPKCNASCMISELQKNEKLRTIDNLQKLIVEVNNEDQRLVDGVFDVATGTLKLYTQDMVAGADGEISRREIVITGFDLVDGKDGANGKDGVNGTNGKDGVDGADGKDGVNGVDGKDGVDGTNGRDVDYARHQNDMSAVAGLGGLELRQGGAGVFSWSAGVGSVWSGGSSAQSVAIGLHYGIQDNWGAYGKISKSLDGDSVAGFVGIEGQF